MLRRKIKQGKFIAFEGIDVSGKTTQLELFAEKLRQLGLAVFVTKEPGSPYSEITQKIRRLLLSKDNLQIGPRTELALFFADRAQHIFEPGLLGERLQEGEIILTDRQWASTFAYQFFARQLGKFIAFDELKKINDFFCYGIYPDLNILLDISVKDALSRVRLEKDKSRFDKEAFEFHQRVRIGYLELVRREPEKWLVFNGSQPIEKLADEIFQKVYLEWLSKFEFVKNREVK